MDDIDRMIEEIEDEFPEFVAALAEERLESIHVRKPEEFRRLGGDSRVLR